MQDWSQQIHVASASDVGMRRSTNQDSFEIVVASDEQKWHQRGHFFLVADGMGAHAAGELASKLAADGVPHLYSKYQELSPPEALKRAVIETNAEINRKGQANEEFMNMGTTCSTLTILPQGAVVAHVGDSRVYRLRKKRFEQLTFDHSLVWEMKAAGTVRDDDQSASLIPKNVITRSLGPYPDVNVDLEGPHPVENEDVYLLCSDGLSGEVEDDEMAALLLHLDPDRAARMLVNLANLRGGPDNITVIVAKVTGDKITTANSQGQPLTVGGKKKKKSSNPVPLSLLVASLLVAILCVVMNNLFFAVLFGVVAAGLAGYVAYLFSGADPNEKVVQTNQRFGKGPYSTTEAVSGKKLLERLDEIGDQLQAAANEGELPVGLDELEGYIEKAREASAAADETAAINFYCTGYSNYMAQLGR